MENTINNKQTNFQENKTKKDILIEKALKDYSADNIIIINRLLQVVPLIFDTPETLKLKIRLYNIVVSNDTFYDENTRLSSYLNLTNEINILGGIGEIKVYCKDTYNDGIRDFNNKEIQDFNSFINKLNEYLSQRAVLAKYNVQVNKKDSINSEKISNDIQNDSEFHKFLLNLSLPESEIENITKVNINFKKNETICKQGSFATFIMILKEGLVKAFVETSPYKNHIFKISRPFNIIGLSSLYGDNYYQFSCKALTNSSLFLIERSNFDRIIRTYPDFSIQIMKMYSESLQNIYTKLASIANKQSIGKVCDSLLYLSSKVFESSIIDTRVSRKDIAELSGISAENLVRVLSELKKDNIIDIKNRNIEILNYSSLEMLRNLG